MSILMIFDWVICLYLILNLVFLKYYINEYKYSNNNTLQDFIKISQLTILDIPFQSTTMTINDACKKFGISRQMIDKLINDKKIFVFSTGLSDRGKLMISTYDLIEKANLFPKEALVEIFKMEYEKKKTS